MKLSQPTSLTHEDVKSLVILAENARPLNDDDLGSVRQIDAEDTFFSRVREVLSHQDRLDLEKYTAKATVDESINETMNRLLEPPYNPEASDTPEPLFYDDESGINIYNPYASTCGRFTVNPHEAYGDEFGELLKELKHESKKGSVPGI